MTGQTRGDVEQSELPALALAPSSYLRGMIVYRPGQKRRAPRKRKPSPEITARIVTAYSPARLLRMKRWERIQAARSDSEPQATER